MDDIKCPKCGYTYDWSEDYQGLVTMWGEDGPDEDQCPNCQVVLIIEEIVDRAFEVKLKE